MLQEKELTEIGYALVAASEEANRNWKTDCYNLIKHIRELEALRQYLEIKERNEK